MMAQNHPEGRHIRIDLPMGSVQFVPSDAPGIEVKISGAPDQMRTVLRGDVVIIEPAGRALRGSVDVVVSVGHVPDVELRLATASVVSSVPIADLSAKSATGDMTFGVVEGSARIKTATGRITVGEARGSLDVTGASTDVTVHSVDGPCRLKTASGDLHVVSSRHDIDAKTVSGDVDIETCAGRSVFVKTLSGDVSLGIPAGRVVDVDLRSTSGSVTSELVRTDGPRSGRISVSVVSVSGTIRLVSAKESEL